MIAIINVGPHDDPDPTGWRTYEVRINHEVIATFRHKRDGGLVRCLRLASEAVLEKQMSDYAKVFTEWRKENMKEDEK